MHITQCKQCGIMVRNSDLCDLCKAGHTAQESTQIRIKESLAKAKQVSSVLTEMNTSERIVNAKTTY